MCRRNLRVLVNLPVMIVSNCSWIGLRGKAEHTKAGTEGEELVTGDGGSEVRDRQAHVVAARLVKTEDIAISVRRVVERRDEVLERGARVVGQLGEQDLGLFFCERAHIGRCIWDMCFGVVMGI